MFPERWPRFKELLDRALELAPDERTAWLASLSDEDRHHREALQEWLSLEEHSGGFLHEPLTPGASWERDLHAPLAPGSTFAGYRIVRVLGVGGTSLVYEAEQRTPRRAVALKVFQRDLAGEDRRRRFADEASILAGLAHPGIARVFEAGTAGEGSGAQPWIAMELVPGARPVTVFADERGLDRRARLELFARLAEAVAHGHQRGVIHRDLKPANLLVDVEGASKVIDFGVAKALGSGPSRLNTTRDGSLVGTFAWMSPEQLGGLAGEVDTRSDVWALGVVLFELLCGAPPVDFDTLPLDEALRHVRHEPLRFPVRIPRDLQAILRVALAKDPDGRYPSAAEFARDVRRTLARQPIQARPPGIAGHLRLLLARHRGVAAASALGALLLVASLIWGELQSSRVEAAERAKARTVTNFLESVLSLGSPSTVPRSDLTMREVLDDASVRIETELAAAPEARAEIHSLVGSAWRELGEVERAERHLRASAELFADLKPRSWEHAGSLSILSELLLQEGRGEEAETVLLEARELYAALDDLPPFYLGIVTNKLAGAYRLQNDLPRAEVHARQALTIYREAFGEAHIAVASAHETLAGILFDQGSTADAIREARKALRIQRVVSAPGSLSVAEAQLTLARCLGQGEEACRLLEAASQVFGAALPAGHARRVEAAALAVPCSQGR